MDRFTVTSIKALKTGKNARNVWEEGKGRNQGRLGIKVYPSGRKVFYFRYFVGGKAKMIGLGDFPELSLTDARVKANKLSVEVSDGIDPKARQQQQEFEEAKRLAAIKQREEAELLLGSMQQLYEYHMSVLQRKNRPSYYKAVKAAYQKNLFTVIDPLKKARDVTSREIAQVIANVYNTSPVQSNRVRSYFHAGFNLALKHDNDPANLSRNVAFDLTYNPVTNIPRQAEAERVIDRFLSEAELAEFLAQIKIRGFHPLMRFTVELMVLSGGQRPNEIMTSEWKEIDFTAGEWFFPPTKTKNKKPHIVPVQGRLKEKLLELRELTGDSLYLVHNRLDKTLPGRPDGLGKAFKRHCEVNKLEAFTPRDIRRTCKTLMIRHQLASKEIVDRLHNHAASDVSSKHYNKHDYLQEKRDLLKKWELSLESF